LFPGFIFDLSRDRSLPHPPPPSFYLEQRVPVHFSDIQSKLLYDPPTYTPSWLSSWTEKTEIEILRILGGGGGGRIICRQKRNKTQNKSNHSHTLNAFFPCSWSGVPLPAWRTDLLIRTQFLSIVSLSPMSCVSVLLCTISQSLMSPVYGGLGGGRWGALPTPPPCSSPPPPPLAPFSAPKFKTKSLSKLTY
jgi:hypothetical protein